MSNKDTSRKKHLSKREQQGFKRLQVLVHEDDEELVRKYVTRTRLARLRKIGDPPRW